MSYRRIEEEHMSPGLFKKASASARDQHNLEDLIRFREKAAARKLVLEKHDKTPSDILARVEASLKDYDDRIMTKRAALKKQAEQEFEKEAQFHSENAIPF